MTVLELIRELEKMPKNDDVICEIKDDYYDCSFVQGAVIDLDDYDSTKCRDKRFVEITLSEKDEW